jgi:hypothetical protein
MRLIILLSPVIAFGLCVLSANRVAASSLPFHKAQTAQEKTLESLFHQAEEKSGFIFSVLRREPLTDEEKDRANNLFTDKLVEAWRDKEKNEVKRTCSGHSVEGEICGLDYDPLLCAQDDNDGLFLFQTEREDSDQVIISMRWNDNAPSSSLGSYRLIKEDNKWKLDGVACANGGRFNMIR